MSSVLFYLVFVFGIFTVTEQRKKPLTDENIIEYLSDSKKSPLFRTQKRRLQGADNPNLMNIQTPNLFYKHNNMRDAHKKQLDKNLDEALRLESDRICRITGRCGCTGGRCGGPSRSDDRDARTVNEIEQLLRDLEDDLDNKQDEDRRNVVENSKKYDDDKDDDEFYSDLKRAGKKYKNDNLDVIFLEVPDSSDKLQIKDLQDVADNVKIVDLRDIDLENILNNRKAIKNDDNVERMNPHVTPEQLTMFYNAGKKEIVHSLSEYVKGLRDSSYLANLTPNQRSEVNVLKENFKHIPIIDDEVNEILVRILFGDSSNIRVLSQSQDNNIYVPQNMYRAIVKYVKNKNLRIKKRNVLPLTSQQKQRLLKQNQGKPLERKIISKHTWRRNMQDAPKYGVPFNLEVQGLGQLN